MSHILMPGSGGAASLTEEDLSSLKHILDAIPHPVFIKDENHRFVVLNETICDLIGHPHDVLVGKTDYDFLPKEQADVFWEKDQLVLNTGKVNVNEEVVSDGRGGLRSVVTSKKRARLANGARLIVVSISDITELKQREASWRLLFENNPVPMWVYDRSDFRLLAVNDAALAHYGYSREQLLSMTVLDIRPQEDVESFRKVASTSTGLSRRGYASRHLKSDGSLMDVMIYSEPVPYEGFAASMVALLDVTERKRAEDNLRRTREFLDTVVENIPTMLFAKEARDHRYVLINRAGEQLLGVSRDEIIGKTDHDLFSDEEADVFLKRDQEVLRSDDLQIVQEEAIHTKHGGRRDLLTKRLAVESADGASKYLLGVAEDITEQKRAAARIAHLANHDALTDLPNRLAFNDRLEFTLERAQAKSESFAVLCFDLDRFKGINDVFGHAAGDALLQEVSRRVVDAADGAFVARVGGDEFTLIATSGSQPAATAALADRLLECVAGDIEIEGNPLQVGMSIGIAFFPEDGLDAATLLANADAALYRAKADGRGVFRVFEPEMDRRLRDRRSMERDLRSALAHNEILLHYQPQSMMSGEIVGFEALARWYHPKRGMVPPDQFIPLAEDSGLILSIGEWVLREACKEAASWQKPLHIAVNLSPVQFQYGDIVNLVHTVLLETGLSPNRLELEITEGVLFDDLSRATSILRRLKALGVRIAMDDFGTGYSSLSYLQSFPFDKIKIDKSFVSNVRENSQSAAIIRAIIGLGSGLSMDITAEGVETATQLEFLKQEHCTEVQGYLVGRPYPIDEYAEEVGNPSLVPSRNRANSTS